MAITKRINQTDLNEIKDHLRNTAKDLVKGYTISQLSLMDWIDTRAVKKSWKYIPIRVDTATSKYYYETRKSNKPYMTFRIRLDEIKYLFNKRTWKHLGIIDNKKG